jgi:hypothetical protein
MSEPVELLEEMVDANGVKGVLQDLVAICYEKAIHIDENWQDTALAQEWEDTALEIDNFLNSIDYPGEM